MGRTTWTEQARAIYFESLGRSVIKSIDVQTALEELDDYISGLTGGGTGAQGPAGESAYQIWLDAGNIGTEADFLNSLIGPQGSPGPQGVQAGLEIASAVLTSPTNPATAGTYVTQGQLVAPAGSPAHQFEVVGGLPVQVATGTVAVETLFRVDVAVFDEANALVAYSPHHFSQGSTATNKVPQTTLPCQASLPANPSAAKTYTLQVRATVIGTNGSSASVLVGGAFPNKTIRLTAR